MLARASGLAARLAVGYLPGDRDPLSGAYTVRGKHAHAWAEILFQEHGWVPFDATPRPDLPAAGRVGGGQLGGLKYFLESSVGDELLKELVAAPSRLSGGLKNAFSSPLLSTMLAALAPGALLVGLGWLCFRLTRNWRRLPNNKWPYHRLPGDGRDEMLRTFRKVEKLLRRNGIQVRKPGESLQEYTRAASQRASHAEIHLAWFTQATWAAAYNPAELSSSLVHDAKARLSQLKVALG